MRLFLDANVLVDVVLRRVDTKGKPLWFSSTLILDDVSKRKHEGYVSALSLYIVNILLNPTYTKTGDLLAREKVSGFRRFLSVIDFTDSILQQSIEDVRLRVEDAVQFKSAVSAKAEALVTRNVRHFMLVKNEIQILVPENLMRQA